MQQLNIDDSSFFIKQKLLNNINYNEFGCRRAYAKKEKYFNKSIIQKGSNLFLTQGKKLKMLQVINISSHNFFFMIFQNIKQLDKIFKSSSNLLNLLVANVYLFNINFLLYWNLLFLKTNFFFKILKVQKLNKRKKLQKKFKVTPVFLQPQTRLRYALRHFCFHTTDAMFYRLKQRVFFNLADTLLNRAHSSLYIQKLQIYRKVLIKLKNKSSLVA